MRKFLSIILASLVALQLTAAHVDVATAQSKAQQYLASKVYAGKHLAPSATEATLIMTQMGDVNSKTPVFYVFNTSTTYVIVSADDRAEEILAYGDKPLNLDRIPDGLQYMFDMYKEQLDWLISNPDAKVDKPTTYKAPSIKSGETYGPLLTALWDQEAPYWNQCKFTYSGTQYQCLTGCPATSASMVLYYWKYPTTPVGPLSAYTSTLDLSYYNSVSYTYAALPETTFDWANMKDSYSTYNTAQANAVATLMRYVGQAERMMYGTSSAGGSGISVDDAQIVATMFKSFGYDETTTRLVKKSSYTEANWAALLQEEMAAGRPVVFMGVSSGWGGGGHAFNVDGYNSSTNKYHVNFGWSGDGNNWYAMNAFGYSGDVFSSNQQMVIGIQPGVPRPAINVSETTLRFSCNSDESATASFVVTGENLSDDITLTLTDANGVFTVDPSTVTIEEAVEGKEVTVTFTPMAGGNFNGKVTVRTTDASDITVSLIGTAQLVTLPKPTLNAASNVSSTSFTASWTHDVAADVTYTLSVTKGGATVANITEIAAKNYTVTGLIPGNSYYFRVKAVPVNPNMYAESAWSNQKIAKLPADFETGDLNGDGAVDVTDLNILINIILNKDQAENYGNRAYITNDNEIDVTDVNALINIILAKPVE